MGFFKNVFKKDKDEREAAYQPSSDDTKAVEAKGSGKASGKNIEKPDGGFTDAQQQRISRSRTDSNWGYYDPNTGNYVPWYIDAQDGGGKNQSGDTFEGAGLYSMVLNAAGVAPYGYNRPRTYARSGMVGRPELPRPTGGGTPTVTPQPAQSGPSVRGRPTPPSVQGAGYSMPTQIGNSASGMMNANAAPQTAGPIMAGHNLPPIQGAAPSEQALRERAVQLYGQGFLNLTPSSQKYILQGLAQGMGNAN